MLVHPRERFDVEFVADNPDQWAFHCHIAHPDTPPADPTIPALVPGPDWLRLRLLVEGEPLSFETGETLAHARTLDFRRGVLLRVWRWRNSAGRVVQLQTLRFCAGA